MKLNACRTLLTGAGSGIGRSLAEKLSERGARLVLLGRDRERLEETARNLAQHGGSATSIAFDLAAAEGHERVISETVSLLGGLDLLINNAGVSSFREFSAETADGIRRLIDTNLTAPLLLTRAALPAMLDCGSGRIVNVGSILGSIGLPHFAAYSASKFGLRGFSQALRRELADTGVQVTYVAPRTTRTAINPEALYRMSEATGTATDSPDAVADAIVAAIEGDRDEAYLGWPEKLFVRINALLPKLVDGALRKQTRIARRFVRTDA